MARMIAITRGREQTWWPTHHQLRAAVIATGALLAAALLHRPDVLVLSTPFVVVATWAAWRRPRDTPQVSARLGHDVLREGDATTWRADLRGTDGIDEVMVEIAQDALAVVDPAEVIVTATTTTGQDAPDIASVAVLRSTRWGRRVVGQATISAQSAWGAYRWGPVRIDGITVTTVPAAARFDPLAPVPHPVGLVGLYRARRRGSGGEVESLREFVSGDRLRRVHWPASLRTGRLHVAATHADEDSHVALIVDALSDLGPREGIDGRATSLDLTVRAAAAMAEHHLGVGDRVTLRVFGAAGRLATPTGSGSAHLVRVLHALARISPATDRTVDPRAALHGLNRAGAVSLAIVLTPLIDPMATAVVATSAAQGIPTVVVDTMPEHLWQDTQDPAASVAWRLRRLHRRAEIDRLTRAGVAVVPWRGPASLDAVLTDVARRRRAPRIGTR